MDAQRPRTRSIATLWLALTACATATSVSRGRRAATADATRPLRSR